MEFTEQYYKISRTIKTYEQRGNSMAREEGNLQDGEIWTLDRNEDATPIV